MKRMDYSNFLCEINFELFSFCVFREELSVCIFLYMETEKVSMSKLSMIKYEIIVFLLEAFWIYVLYSAYTVSLCIHLLSIASLIPKEISIVPKMLIWKTTINYYFIEYSQP